VSILAIENPVFQRAMRVISSITNDYPAVVTTTFAHQYLDGLVVRLIIPKGYGMTQANQLYAPIIVTGDTTFTIDIDARYFDKFITTLIVDTTDGSGNASGNIYSQVTVVNQPAAGQTFTIGTQVFNIPFGGGNLTTSGAALGTYNISTGAYTFTGASASTSIVWNPISFPYNQQYPQTLPTAEKSDTLLNATQNILPFNS